MATKFEELILKYSVLNDFALSEHEAGFYKTIFNKLDEYLNAQDDLFDFPLRFHDSISQININADDVIIVVADTKGCICFANSIFYQYSRMNKLNIDEYPGTIKISELRHPDMPASVYKDLWLTISQGRIWSGIICNRNKLNQDYWQVVNIFPIIDGGNITNYIAFNKAVPKKIIDEIVQHYRKIS